IFHEIHCLSNQLRHPPHTQGLTELPTRSLRFHHEPSFSRTSAIRRFTRSWSSGVILLRRHTSVRSFSVRISFKHSKCPSTQTYKHSSLPSNDPGMPSKYCSESCTCSSDSASITIIRRRSSSSGPRRGPPPQASHQNGSSSASPIGQAKRSTPSTVAQHT